jgi:aspartyl-tRNA(Asn)/glutamyl-tRNA(Gln) amidotransferase subunit C
MINIKKYEAMAKLDLSDDERKCLSARIEALTDSFSVLETVDTANVEPLVTVSDINNALRDDIAERFITRDELLSNAPEQYDGYFQVPKTVE